MHQPAHDTDRPFITVEEAASLLGISRSLAYGLAREYLATQTTGLPCARIGSRRVVIARKSLDRYAAANDTTPTRDHNHPKDVA